MEGIKIFSDSTCDLPIEEVNRMNIGIIPLTINFGEEVYNCLLYTSDAADE